MQISIVEAWANLPEDCYFTKDLTYGPKQKKCELSDVFERSMNLLSAHGPYDELLWLRAATNAYKRYQKAFSKKSWTIKATRIFHKLFSDSLYARYEAFVNRMVSEAALTYKGQIYRFKCLCAAEYTQGYYFPYHDFRSDFIFRVFNAVRMNILSAQEFKGFFYELKRDQRVVCYTIGTFHMAPRWVLEDQRISKILERSRELFVEKSIGVFVSSVLRTSIHLITFGTVDWPDLGIMSLAKSNRVKISDLDSVDSMEQEVKCLEKKPASLEEERRVLAEIEEWERVESASESFLMRDCDPSTSIRTQVVATKVGYMGFLEAAECFISGNEKFIEFLINAPRFPGGFDSGCKRNARWTEQTLLPRLREGNSPFCIAVGAAHLFGEIGLLRIFAQNGLEIHRLNSAQDIT